MLENTTFLLAQANIALNLNKYSLAEKKYAEILIREPFNPSAYWGIATSLAQQDKTAEAIKYLEEALSKQLETEQIFDQLCHIYLTNYSSRHLEINELWLKRFPNSFRAHLLMSKLLVKYYRPNYSKPVKEQILLHANTALKLNPSNEQNIENMGSIYAYVFNNYKAAVENYLIALKIQPNAAYLHNNLGNIYLRYEKFKLAENQFIETLRIDPSLKAAENNLKLVKANYYRKIKRYIVWALQIGTILALFAITIFR